MNCKKCNSDQIQIIKKNSGQKLYHCNSCGYNFGERDFFHENVNIGSYPECDLYKFFPKAIQQLFIKLDSNNTVTKTLKNLFNLIGSLTALFVISLFGFLLISSLDLLVTNTKYGQIGALIAGFLLFSLLPIFYIQFMKNLFDNREGLFSQHKIGFLTRFGYLLGVGIVGIFNLFLVGLMILFVPAAAKDIINGSKIECMTFVRISDQQTSRGGSGARIYKNYVEFRQQNGQIKKLADLKLDYKKIPSGSQICFDKFESLNIYGGDRLE